LFSVKSCQGRSAFQVLLEKETKLELKPLCELLTAYEIVACTPYVIVLKKDGLQLSLYATGKLLVQNTDDKETAESAAKELYGLLGLL